MDELAKTEARNYLSAAGFFLMGAWALLYLINTIASGSASHLPDGLTYGLGIGLLIVATLLIVLKKRDMLALLFMLFGFLDLINNSKQAGLIAFIVLGFILLIGIVVLTGKDKKKWIVFILMFICILGTVLTVLLKSLIICEVTFGILAVLTIYFAFCCACERCKLPGSKLLTTEEQTDFKASGSVLGYMLFAIITGGYALHYLLGEAILPLETFVTMELICGVLLIFVAILLLAVGKMRYTPIMFLLMGLTGILSMYSTGFMFIGIGILWIIVGLFAMLRKESRILPGIMLIVYGCTWFFTAFANGAMISAPVVSVILNAIPCLIAIYLSFVVFSQRKLPKF